MDERRPDYPYSPKEVQPWQRTVGPPAIYQQLPQGYPPTIGPEALAGAQVLTQGGFKPLSREEREEAARIAVEAGFSFDGYQVVRREFFSHRYDPTLTIKGNSIIFNNACISRLE